MLAAVIHCPHSTQKVTSEMQILSLFSLKPFDSFLLLPANDSTPWCSLSSPVFGHSLSLQPNGAICNSLSLFFAHLDIYTSSSVWTYSLNPQIYSLLNFGLKSFFSRKLSLNRSHLQPPPSSVYTGVCACDLPGEMSLYRFPCSIQSCISCVPPCCVSPLKICSFYSYHTIQW